MSLEPNFDTVLQAARTGAEWAWVQIYRDLSPSVLRYLRARGAAEPEDLLGEVFVGVVRNLSGFEGSEPEFRAWVFRSARNALIDTWRRDARRPVEYLPNEALPVEAGDDDAEGGTLSRVSFERVRATLAKLPDRQRDVVFLRVIAGLTIEEVADVLGKTPGAVKSLQARGLAAIRREISREAVSS